jgi:hypothetical protein
MRNQKQRNTNETPLAPSFGFAKARPPVSAPSPHLLSAKDLPAKGIFFHVAPAPHVGLIASEIPKADLCE